MEQTYQGMLDEFAGRAMQAMMRIDPSATVEEVAGWSYQQALAMMKERERIAFERLRAASGKILETHKSAQEAGVKADHSAAMAEGRKALEVMDQTMSVER